VSKETYLGDGLYASHDGHMFCLRAPRLHGDDYVYLEPEVMREFVEYVGKTLGLKITVKKIERETNPEQKETSV